MDGRKERRKEGTKEGFLYSAYQMLGEAFTLGLFHITATAKLEVSPIISITQYMWKGSERESNSFSIT